jgi:DNA transposition AAA+ family ATPase
MMHRQFIHTENYNRFLDGIDAVERRGAREAGMMLVHGAPGRGKSHIVAHWAVNAKAVFLRANVDWTPKYMLVELAKSMYMDSRGTAQQLFERLLERIVEEQKPIVIDEAEFTLSQNAAVLEKIRDISDRAEVTVVLIGMDKIQQQIARHKQIHSRIAQVVEFNGVREADVALASKKLCEADMPPAMMTEVHRLSGGRMREVLNIISAVENTAQCSNLTTVDVHDMKGVTLSFDWSKRAPAQVKEA